MGLTDRFLALFAPLGRAVVVPAPLDGVDNYLPYVNIAGNLYPFGMTETLRGNVEELDYSITGAARLYGGNGIVFACIAKRQKLFSEARIRYRRMQNGKPGDLWGDASLDILEHPWPNAATGDLLARAILDADLSGNFYATRRNGRIVVMRPDWTSIILGSHNDKEVTAVDLDAEVVGYVYHPGGRWSGQDPVYLLRGEVAHFAPYQDPLARFMGMSWITPVIREIAADSAATSHKLKFFENGATPNMIVKRGVPAANESFTEWVAKMRAASEGTGNAYKTFYMSQGADATVVGKDFQQIEFAATQGAGEVRIIAASGLHPVIVGVSESLQGSSLNSGNFGAARRLTADTFLRPDWRNFMGSMETLVKPPAGNQLWYDDKDIPFLREDSKDAALIQQTIGLTIGQYVRDGFTAESAVKATLAENPSLLKHTGLFSVQLMAPGATKMPVGEAPGEIPVGPGTKPEVPATTKPTNGTAKPAPTGGKA